MDDSDNNQKRKKLSVINPTNMTRTLFGKKWILTALCKGIQGRGFRIPDTAIQILCQWNVDSEFQTVAEFRIPEGKHYPDSGFLKQKFPDSGIRITLHGSYLNSKLFAPIGVLKKTITSTSTLPAPDAACLSSIMGCPGGMSTDPIYSQQYLRALFGPIFRYVFLEKDGNGKKDRCAVLGCNNDRLFPEIRTLKFSFCPKSAHKY